MLSTDNVPFAVAGRYVKGWHFASQSRSIALLLKGEDPAVVVMDLLRMLQRTMLVARGNYFWIFGGKPNKILISRISI